MGSQVHLRLYEELNDFLEAGRRRRRFVFELNGVATVGEMLSRLGVPLDQVEIVLVNGDSVDFSHPLKDADIVSAYPVFESLDVKPLLRVRSRPLRRTRFIVERGLAHLTRRLRALGFDAVDAGSRPWETVVRVAESERRVFLTAHPLPAELKELTRVYRVRSSRLRDQLKEVLSRLDIMHSAESPSLQPLTARKMP